MVCDFLVKTSGVGNGPGDPEKNLILNPEPGPDLKFSPETGPDPEFPVRPGKTRKCRNLNMGANGFNSKILESSGVRFAILDF